LSNVNHSDIHITEHKRPKPKPLAMSIEESLKEAQLLRNHRRNLEVIQENQDDRRFKQG